mmetsp:Transcript_45985/g.87755  ORF Transcript_45985/g.87755 Transcript_45985/m.87755 type:complete len:231 (+) Transcript_45985:769-1461(+)
MRELDCTHPSRSPGTQWSMLYPPTSSWQSGSRRPEGRRVSMSSSGVCVMCVLTTPSVSARVRAATRGEARNAPAYISLEAQSLMAAFIRYWVVRHRFRSPPYMLSARSNKDTDRPCWDASREITVGGSCWESPTSTARRQRRSGIQVAGSVAWPASSTTARSKPPSLSSDGVPAPASVHSTTCASFSRASSASFWCFASIRFSLRVAALICFFTAPSVSRRSRRLSSPRS